VRRFLRGVDVSGDGYVFCRECVEGEFRYQGVFLVTCPFGFAVLECWLAKARGRSRVRGGRDLTVRRGSGLRGNWLRHQKGPLVNAVLGGPPGRGWGSLKGRGKTDFEIKEGDYKDQHRVGDGDFTKTLKERV